MRSNRALVAFAAAFLSIAGPVLAQDPPTPAPPADQLPPVDVIQKQPAPAPKAVKKSAAKKKSTVSPTPVSAPVEPTASDAMPYYGPAGGRGAAQRAENGPSSPIDPLDGILPGNLQGFPSAGTAVTTSRLRSSSRAP